MRLGILLTSLIVAGLFATPVAYAGNPFEIVIELSKAEYKVGETLDGKIEIENQYPATLPVTFEMKLYHNGKFKRDARVYVKGFPSGDLSFELKVFRLPQQPFKRKDLGVWTIVIKQLSADDSTAAKLEFKVVEK